MSIVQQLLAGAYISIFWDGGLSKAARLICSPPHRRYAHRWHVRYSRLHQKPGLVIDPCRWCISAIFFLHPPPVDDAFASFNNKRGGVGSSDPFYFVVVVTCAALEWSRFCTTILTPTAPPMIFEVSKRGLLCFEAAPRDPWRGAE